MYRSYVARAAVIGFGSGMTTTTLLDAPAIQRVDTIEIEPAMVQGAKAFLPRVEGAFADPRSRIIFDDAKAYFARSRDTYDVIVSQPSNPWVSRGASLFTAEFYERIRRKLKPDGLFIQSLQCYEFDLPLLADIVAALDTSFTDYALYTTSGELVLVATPTGRLGLPGTQPLLTEPLASDLRALGINRIADLAALWAGSRATVDAYLQSVTLARNSDYFPVVELDAPLRRFTGARVTEFESLALAAVPVLRMLDQRAPAASEGVSRPASPEVNVPVAFYHAEQALRFLDSVGERDARPTPPGYPGQIDSFRAALIDCTSPTRTSDAWDDVVFVAGMVNPALPPERLDAFWNKIGQSRCVKDLPDYYRTWIALFRDVGNRDSVGMVRHAETLLKLPGTTTQLEYLLLAETTGLLSQGRNAEARRWLVGDVPSSTKDLPWYQLATMLANGT
jgi:SAM-dependent methyltransferase